MFWPFYVQLVYRFNEITKNLILKTIQHYLNLIIRKYLLNINVFHICAANELSKMEDMETNVLLIRNNKT